MRRARVLLSGGFTVVELAVVVTLASLVMLVALAVIRQPHLSVHRAEQFDSAVGFEESVRRLARRAGKRCLIEYDLDRDEVSCIEVGRRGRHLLAPLELSYGVKIARVWGSSKGDVRSGRIRIVVDERGMSKTYGIELAAPGREVRRVLFAGASGVPHELSTGKEVLRVLRALEASGNDAD